MDKFNFTDLYVLDKSTKKIHRIGDERHDSLYVNDADNSYSLRYYNLQNGDGGGLNDEDGHGYVILQSLNGLLTDEYGIIDKRYEKEISEYIAQHAAEIVRKEKKNEDIHNNDVHAS